MNDVDFHLKFNTKVQQIFEIQKDFARKNYIYLHFSSFFLHISFFFCTFARFFGKNYYWK